MTLCGDNATIAARVFHRHSARPNRVIRRMRHTAVKFSKYSAPERAGPPAFPPKAKSARRWLLCAALTLAALPAFAIDWTFKAFGTLAAIGTDTDKIGFRRDYTQTRGATSAWRADIDSRLGLQLDADFNREFHAAVQWVARNHAGNFFEQNLEWAFLRWRPRDDLDLRLGRLGLDAFLLSDYRNVGYAYLWMRPPAEFYAPIFPYHFDGADIAKKFSLGEGYLTLKGYAGYSLSEVLDQTGTATNSLETSLFGGNLVYESGNWRARLGYAQLRALNHLPLQVLPALENPVLQAYWPAARSLAEQLSIHGKLLHFVSLGWAYDDGVWPAQAEAAYIDSAVPELPSMANAYLSVGRRFGSVTLYSLFGIAESLNHRATVPYPLAQMPALLGLRDSVEQSINGNGVDQKSASLGLRWDVHNNIALKAQWSHFWLGSNGTLFWFEPKPPLPDQVNVWSFGVDFVY